MNSHGNMYMLLKLFLPKTQWTGMKYWQQKLFGMKYCSDIWFLHATGLVRHQRSQKNLQMPKKILKAKPKSRIVVCEMATRFHQGGHYIYPCQHWKSEITLIYILLRTLASWPIYGLSMVFMALQLKSMAFPTKITSYDLYQLKKL